MARRNPKPFTVETHWDSPIASVFGIDGWWLWRRYATEARRDQALAALRGMNERRTFGFNREYRAGD